MSYEADPGQPFNQPEQNQPLQTERKSWVRGIAIVNPTNLTELLDSEVLPPGANIQISSGDNFGVRFANGETAENGDIPISADYMRIKGTDDHVEIKGRSRVTYAVAPTLNQGEFVDYTTYVGIPGVQEQSVGQKDKVCTLEYVGSEAGNVIDTILGDDESPTHEQLKVIEHELRGLNIDSRLGTYSPVAFGVPMEREIANIYDWHIQDTLKRQTGQAITSFAAKARFGVFGTSKGELSGMLLTTDAHGINRIHQLGDFRNRETSTKKKGSAKSGDQTSEIISRWFATMESPDFRMDFGFLSGRSTQSIYNDLFTVMGLRIAQTKGEALTLFDIEKMSKLALHGFNIDAPLAQERADFIAERVKALQQK